MHCVRAPVPYPREKSVSDRNRERAKGRAVHLTTVVSWSPFFVAKLYIDCELYQNFEHNDAALNTADTSVDLGLGTAKSGKIW
jgi:hypothetical protein